MLTASLKKFINKAELNKRCEMNSTGAYRQFETILDSEEVRFPIGGMPPAEKIRTLFYSATRNQWNPQTDIPWDELDPSQFTDEERYCARQYWSRRAYSEYGAISESPALSIRYCQEDCPIDIPLFFSIRTQEESRHAEACFLMAERLGGYIEEPAEGFEGVVATHGVRKMALDPNTPLEAMIAALVCAAEEIAFDVFKHLGEITSNPVAKAVILKIKQDEVRHCAFGWYLLEYRIEQMTDVELKEIEAAVINMIENVELKGYHSAWLAGDSKSTEAEIHADRVTWKAGLGATVEELEKPVFVESIRKIRDRFATLGITIPMFQHPKLGTF